MDEIKKGFNDYVEEFTEYIEDSRAAFIKAEEESEAVLQSKLAKNRDFAQKIEERYVSRMEKHNEGVIKSKETYDEKTEKSNVVHQDKKNKLDEAHVKTLSVIENKQEKEKIKLEKSLSKLETKFLRNEKNCLTEIEKTNKKAEAYNVENSVNRTEKDAQSKIKNIQNKLQESLKIELEYKQDTIEVINKLKQNQADTEIQLVEYEARVQKLNDRLQQEELSYEAAITQIEQNSLREELKFNYDLDKNTANFEYDIANEQLKTEERKAVLGHKFAIEEEDFRYYEESQGQKRSRKDQLEKERVELETIIQKDNMDNVKNNFALSNKEHKNLYIYEKALHGLVNDRESTNYKLSIDEIDIRSKQLMERVKIAIGELKSDLDFIVSKVKVNLKTELEMPTKHIKLFETKFKNDQKELTKTYQTRIKEINDKLIHLDPIFDSDEIKELHSIIEDTESRYDFDMKRLERDLSNIVGEFNKKIAYANDRADTIISEAQKLYDKQVSLYNGELDRIKENADTEKKEAKKLLERVQTENKEHLRFVNELNQLAIEQNDINATNLIELSEHNIHFETEQQEKRMAKNLATFEKRVEEKRKSLQKLEHAFRKEVRELESKLENYTHGINKKLEFEKNRVNNYIIKLQAKLKTDISKVTKEHTKLVHSYEKAIKVAEIEYKKKNQILLKQQTTLLEQMQEEVKESDYDILYG
jgi:hypothetical protein